MSQSSGLIPPDTPTSTGRRTSTAVANRTKALKTKKGNRKETKIMKMLGALPPQTLLDEQRENVYEPSNGVAVRFQKRKAVQCLSFSDHAISYLSKPPPPSIPDDEAQSEINVLNKVSEVLELDLFVLQTLCEDLEKENECLEQVEREKEQPRTPTNRRHSSCEEVPAPFVSVVEISRRAASVSSLNTSMELAMENRHRAQQFMLPGTRALNHNPSPIGGPSRVRSLIHPNGDRVFTRLRDPPPPEDTTRLFRFKVVKINRFRKNTSRILELYLGATGGCTLTICKQKGTDPPDAFTERDRTITRETFEAIDEMPESNVGLVLHFVIGKEGRKKREKKAWRVLFPTPESRDRFHSLVVMNMMSIAEAREKEKKAKNDRTGRRSTQGLSYIPQPLRFNREFMIAVRQLPDHQLVQQLHHVWTLQRREDGWTWGPEIDRDRRRHPLLVPFQTLRPKQLSFFSEIVSNVLESLLTLGLEVTRKDNAISTGNMAVPGATAAGVREVNGEACMYSHQHVITKTLLQRIEFLARNLHEWWAEGKLCSGWTLGPLDFVKHTHPNLLQFDMLSADQREYERNAAYLIVGLLIDWGYTIQGRQLDLPGVQLSAEDLIRFRNELRS